MFDWAIGIDFGTLRSAGAACEIGRSDATTVSPLEIEGARWMPSAVLLDPERGLLVGAAVDRAAAAHPDRLEQAPKAALGQPAPLLLGGVAVDARDAVAAVLRTIATEGSLRLGGHAPRAAAVTHPARWAEVRCDALRDAAERAGLRDVLLVPEPIAAAWQLAHDRSTGALLTALEVGATVAVYDLGGDSFDATVVRRTQDGFEMIGLPGGDDSIGGARFEHLLFRWFGECLGDADPVVWEQMRTSDEPEWRGAAADLRVQVRRAKEALSAYTSTQVFVPIADRDVLVNRSQFEAMIVDDVERSVEVMADVVTGAGIRIDDLAAVLLIGGSARIPLVSQLVAERFGAKRVRTNDEPKGDICAGAARLAARHATRATLTNAPTDAAATTANTSGGKAALLRTGAAFAPPTPPLAPPSSPSSPSSPSAPAAPTSSTRPDPRSVLDTTTAPRLTLAWRSTISPASGQPAADRKGVVIGARDGTVRYIDGATGQHRWHVDAGAPVWAAPAIDDDLVVVAALDGRVAAFDRATGATRWMGNTGAPVAAAPAICGPVVMLADDSGTVVGLERTSGRMSWSLPVGSAVRADLQPTGNGAIVATVAGQVYSIEAATGVCRWGYRMASGALTAPAIVVDRVIVATDAGLVYGLDLATGAAVYGVQCSGRCVSGVAASLPFFAVVDTGGILRVHRADTGQVVAERALSGGRELGPTSTSAAGVLLTPFPAPTSAIVETGGQLVAIDLASGATLFSVATGAGNRTTPVMTGGLVVVATTFGQLLAVVSPSRIT